MRSFLFKSGNYYLVLLWRLLIVWFLLFISRFVFYFLNKDLFPGIIASDWSSILYGGFVFDVAGMLYFNILLIVLMTVPIPYKWRVSDTLQKIVKWIFFVTNGIGLVLTCIDIIYYRFTLRRTTRSVFKEFSNEENTFSLGYRFVLDYWYVVLILILFISLMVWLYNRVKIKVIPVRSQLGYYVSATVFFLLAIPLTILGIRGHFFEHSSRPITISNVGDYIDKPQATYLVLNTPFCFVRTFKSDFLTEVHYFSEPELETIYTPVHQPDSAINQAFSKKNVVVILLESFGKEAVGFYNKDLDSGKYEGFTPFLDSLASVSKVFWQSFASGHKSIDALPSIIASIPSVVDPFALTPYVSDSIQSLAHILGNEGYHNSFFHGAPNGSMGFLPFMKLMGVNNYYGKNEYGNNDDFDGFWGIWDEPFMQFFAKKLNELPQPFYSTFFSVSSHHPFNVPEQYQGWFKKGPLPLFECIGYTDRALQKFFDKASKSDWFKNTIFVISADHGAVRHHQEYQNFWGEIAIPILLYSPGDSALRGIDPGIIQQIDVMPTVLRYLNYNKPFLAFGEDVLNRKDGGFAFNYSGGYRWIEGDYMLFFDGEKSTALYNYKKDRANVNNLLPEEKKVADRMERKLKAFIQQYTNRLIQNRLIAH